MHKIVYNSDYGTISLSPTAIKWLEENACDDIKKFIQETKEKIKNAVSEEESRLMPADAILSYQLLDVYKIPRHHPDLVRCVEELGRNANGSYADLAIKEINGNIYRIELDNGNETVIEPEDYEWITIKDDEA